MIKKALARRMGCLNAFYTNGDIITAEYINTNKPGRLKKIKKVNGKLLNL